MSLTRQTLALLPRVLIVVHDLGMVVLTWIGLRWLASIAGAPPAVDLVWELSLAVGIQGLLLWWSGLYRGLWRFASLPDLANILKAVVIGALLISLVVIFTDRLDEVPRRVLVPYPIALAVLLGAPRLLYRLWKDNSLAGRDANATRVLVLGAGRAAETLLRDLRSDGRYAPVGLLDDTPELRHVRLQGVPVLGTLAELPTIAKETAAGLLVIAMPNATAPQMQRVVALCDEAGLPFRTVPRLSDMLAGQPKELTLDEVRIEDLLGRQPVDFDLARVREKLAGRRILVTGAGGSIGSELARQCARAGAAELRLLERAELPLIELMESLQTQHPGLDLRPLLADCGDEAACADALRDGVDYVFHAAACKHVPLLEGQLREALRNNVLATATVARCARAAGVGNLVLISTDKAIQPINVLGASKRFAELACRAEFTGASGRLSIVRFGNVLDSAGSVVPLFREQIRRGGPVTVTHPEVSRYFMTIPEACQLILQTATLAPEPTAVYTLDMGRPVAIRELAEQMIRLAGKRPGLDIDITYIGLRPGEKLHEVLFHPEETYSRTTHPRILEAHPPAPDAAAVHAQLVELQAVLSRSDATAELDGLLRRAVPEYQIPTDTTDRSQP